jgi:hypothetical protein
MVREARMDAVLQTTERKGEKKNEEVQHLYFYFEDGDSRFLSR